MKLKFYNELPFYFPLMESIVRFFFGFMVDPFVSSVYSCKCEW